MTTLKAYIASVSQAVRVRLGDAPAIRGCEFHIPETLTGLEITPEDTWFALRATRQYFNNASVKFHNVPDFRGSAQVLKPDKVAGVLIQMCIEHLDGHRERPERRAIDSFTHCRYCFQPLFVTVQSFFCALVGSDFGMSYLASTQEIWRSIAQDIMLVGIEVSVTEQCKVENYVGLAMDYISDLSDGHYIVPFFQEVRAWLEGLKGQLTLDTWDEVLSGALKRVEHAVSNGPNQVSDGESTTADGAQARLGTPQPQDPNGSTRRAGTNAPVGSPPTGQSSLDESEDTDNEKPPATFN